MENPEKYTFRLPIIAEAIDTCWVCAMFGDTLELKLIRQEDYVGPAPPESPGLVKILTNMRKENPSSISFNLPSNCINP